MKTSALARKEALILSLKDTTLRRLRQGFTAGVGVVGGVQGVGGCAGDLISVDPASETGTVRLSDEQDWAQRLGRRDTAMVAFIGETWSECASPYSRGGCSAMDV